MNNRKGMYDNVKMYLLICYEKVHAQGSLDVMGEVPNAGSKIE